MKAYLQTNYRIQRAASVFLNIAILLGSVALINIIISRLTNQTIAGTASIFVFFIVVLVMVTRKLSPGYKIMDLRFDEHGKCYRHDPGPLLIKTAEEDSTED